VLAGKLFIQLSIGRNDPGVLAVQGASLRSLHCVHIMPEGCLERNVEP
jgi:hypothetical protein